MLTVLRNRTYAKLFTAHIVALLGTGLLTVALGLLAYDIAGSDAGLVLGTALAIKMVAYVLVAPLAQAITAKAPPKTVLISTNIIRGHVALCLPFVDHTWHIYALIFVLQAASATFTPTFQATIPIVLPDEKQFTRATSLSRFAYDLEALLSPVLAALLLTVTTYHHLFIGTVIGFGAAALLVAWPTLPTPDDVPNKPFTQRLTEGTRLFSTSHCLKGLLAINVVVAAGLAMVLVNTPVLVQETYARTQADVAVLYASSGAGSMLTALSIPWLLERYSHRWSMMVGAVVVIVALLGFAGTTTFLAPATQWPAALVIWFMVGAGGAAMMTPTAPFIRVHCTATQWPAAFAAQFSLSHLCFLVTYPIAGFGGAQWGFVPTALLLTAIATLGAMTAAFQWRYRSPHTVDSTCSSSPNQSTVNC